MATLPHMHPGIVNRKNWRKKRVLRNRWPRYRLIWPDKIFPMFPTSKKMSLEIPHTYSFGIINPVLGGSGRPRMFSLIFICLRRKMDLLIGCILIPTGMNRLSFTITRMSNGRRCWNEPQISNPLYIAGKCCQSLPYVFLSLFPDHPVLHETK